MAKKVFTKTTTPNLVVVNSQTGEIESVVSTVRVDTIDDFIFCFLKNEYPQSSKLAKFTLPGQSLV